MRLFYTPLTYRHQGKYDALSHVTDCLPLNPKYETYNPGTRPSSFGRKTSRESRKKNREFPSACNGPITLYTQMSFFMVYIYSYKYI